MNIKTEQIKKIASTILFAVGVDRAAGNLELSANNSTLDLNISNGEYYIKHTFTLDNPETFRAVVDAKQFLDLVSSFTLDTFSINIADNALQIKSGKSSYKIALIYDNDSIIQIPVISLSEGTPEDPVVSMNVSTDILKSILNTNSREVSKVKNLDVNELQKSYYITEQGCFTFTTGACLNAFSLEKPIKLLLSDKIIKLFKLFDSDVVLTLKHTANNEILNLHNATVSLTAKISNDTALLSQVIGPCEATKNYINQAYTNNIVVSVSALSKAVSRLLDFSKNTNIASDNNFVIGKFSFSQNELTIKDAVENTEVITIENNSTVDETYTLAVNLVDFKLALDSYKAEHINIACGNGKSIVFSSGAVAYLVPEAKLAE